jgi:hypothetical protein
VAVYLIHLRSTLGAVRKRRLIPSSGSLAYAAAVQQTTGWPRRPPSTTPILSCPPLPFPPAFGPCVAVFARPMVHLGSGWAVCGAVSRSVYPGAESHRSIPADSYV